MKSDPTLLRWYRKINKHFFEGACSDRVCVRWATRDDEKEESKCEDKYLGWADKLEDDPHHDFLIVLSRKLNKDSWNVRISTLVHEMCHIATNLKDDHGDAFEQWRVYIAERGIFKKHALAKGRTLF